MRIQFLLPGLHRVHRGAEAAFLSIATEIAHLGLDEVTVIGSGPPKEAAPYRFLRYGAIPRERFERFPKFPPLRSEYVYEEASWVLSYLVNRKRADADITVTCSYPFVNWMLTRWPRSRSRPAHVFVTQNGDWPAYSNKLEYRLFRCDGLVCTNPQYYERNKSRWPSVLIPNGVDPHRFLPGPGLRAKFGLPDQGPIVLMVSALVDSKRVLEGMHAVAQIPNATLVVAGDGPLRDQFDSLGSELMPGRFFRLSLPADQMPDLYRSADVFLHPTFYESFGNVYVEAMAVGLPVVVHDYAVTRWIFGERPGLIDTSDRSDLAAAVRRAIDEKRNPAWPLVAAERFAWSNIAREYRQFFIEVVQRRRASERE
jgi:glycosyltransferase involved in cell wall biosynthesis